MIAVYNKSAHSGIIVWIVGKGSAVLLRSVSLTDGVDLAYENRVRWRRRKVGTSITPRDVANGPGTLCEAFGFDRGFNGLDLTGGGAVYVRSGGRVRVRRTPRVGISRAKDTLWRFITV